MKISTKDLVLDSFGLPTTFPPEMMPEAAMRFVADAKKGMAANAIIALAKSRGFRPMWKALPHMVESLVYGLGLDVNGLQVPLMAKMKRLEQPSQLSPVVAPEQQRLF